MPQNTAQPPALMIQGTASNAGKSLLCAAILRLLARRGYSAAPFKAQNMSLNAHVTRAGLEMGTAQALQALACGLEPDARMNPVLLKPVSERGSQVIVLGKSLGVMSYADYIREKPKIWREVRKAYASLAGDYEIMILEGAGSAAEINLRKNDIVNMRMAHAARAKVILVADIDRGGAFAALAGTMRLIAPRDRALVAGFVLNKFRGDKTLLAPAITRLEKLCRRPFLGVMPLLSGLRLPEEDSLSLKLGESAGLGRGQGSKAGLLDVAVIDLPRISNFTDFDALRLEPGLALRLVDSAASLGRPDLLIIPGSRNSIADLRWLEEQGLSKAILAYASLACTEGRGMLLGICAGLQILGQSIGDPLGLEAGGSVRALGLLPLASELCAEKIVRQVRARFSDSFLPVAPEVSGYEIHHGQSLAAQGAEELLLARDETTGESFPLGWGLAPVGGLSRVWGAYLHGIFDADAFRNALVARLRYEAGLAPLAPTKYSLGQELDRLADALEENLDFKAILALLGK